MPYRWSAQEHQGNDAFVLNLWTHQSLTGRGLAWFVGPTAALFTLPLFAVIGSAIFWVLLAFFVTAIAAMWWAISVNRAQRQTSEELRLFPERIELDHINPGQQVLEWRDNPYWVQVRFLPEGGPVENYLTLKGIGREVELGAFLSADERETLRHELELKLADARRVSQ